jgi:hypothetical protein
MFHNISPNEEKSSDAWNYMAYMHACMNSTRVSMYVCMGFDQINQSINIIMRVDEQRSTGITRDFNVMLLSCRFD